MKKIINSLTALVVLVAVICSAVPSVFAAPYATYTDKNGTKYTLDNSLLDAYDLKGSDRNPLPKISVSLTGCNAEVELGGDGQTIEVTITNWEQYRDDLSCKIFVFNFDSSSRIVCVNDVPVTFITPDDTFTKYTDKDGVALLEISRSDLDELMPTPTPKPTLKPTITNAPVATIVPTSSPTPSVTVAPKPTKTPFPEKTAVPTATPVETKAPAETVTPSAGPVIDKDIQKITVDEYGNKHIIYTNGSEEYLYKNGKRVFYDNSFLKAYDIYDNQSNSLPKARFLTLHCSVEAKRDAKTGRIILTLSDYDKDWLDYVSLPNAIICELCLSRDNQFRNTPIVGTPVRFITPDGTIDVSTDSTGSAFFTKNSSNTTITPSPKPTETPTPESTATPTPTMSPKPTVMPVPTTSPNPTKEPAVTQEPIETTAPPAKEEKGRFSDISSSHWANDIINKATELGVISGYEDGTFRPDNQITHEEFLKLVMSLVFDDEFDAVPENYVYIPGNDRSSHNYWTNRYAAWAQPYLVAALDIDIVVETDYDIGVAETPITRAEMAKIISRAVEYLGEQNTGSNSNVSTKISDWGAIPSEYKDYVASVYSKGILSGYSDGSFGSERSLTRAEASAVIIRLVDKSLRADNK